jgi:hypothetical protein
LLSGNASRLKTFKADFDDVADFCGDTHRVRLDKPIMFPDVIGDHCLIPNVKLLLNAYDSKLLHLILDSSKKRETEIEDKAVYEEVEKPKRRTKALQREVG